MKKIGLGIAILLFAILLSLCSAGMELLTLVIGVVGLFFSIIGFIEHMAPACREQCGLERISLYT